MTLMTHLLYALYTHQIPYEPFLFLLYVFTSTLDYNRPPDLTAMHSHQDYQSIKDLHSHISTP
eukprot:c13380_g1_i2 orf=609-797(-)